MQLVVWQISGLGNQLFQYAAGRHYSQRYGATMRVALAPAKTAFSHGSPRPFLLSHFNIQAPTAEASNLDRLLVAQRRSMQPLVQTVQSAFGIQVFREPLNRRSTFIEEIPIDHATRALYIVGYWQTHKIIDDVESQLRSEFSFREPATGKNLETLKMIQDSNCAVSLHVRRGDYTSAAEGNIALPLSYHERAIDSIRQRENHPTFFVFSDDSAYVRANLHSDARMVFVDHNDDYTSHEDLRLMSQCSHHVIANSTFSWWGAWLNPNPDKMVVAPRQWLLREDTYFPELTPDNWTLLNVSPSPVHGSRYNRQ